MNNVIFFSNGRVEMKIIAEHDDTHLVYLLDNTTTTLIPNGGGTGTTDWTNVVNGTAQYWLIAGGS